MMRRELHLEAGGYDLSLRHATDVDLMTRLMGRTLKSQISLNACTSIAGTRVQAYIEENRRHAIEIRF